MSSDPPVWQSVLLAVFSLSLLYVFVISLTRLSGLRSFTKMSSFDFVLTVATGSMIASAVITPKPPIFVALAVLAMVYVLQMGVAALRLHSARVQTLVDNEPLLLMNGPDVIEEHLRSARVTHDDLRSKLRMAGVTRRDQVMAVVMETSGDVSVLKRSTGDDDIDPWLMEKVRGADQLAGAGTAEDLESMPRQARSE